MNQEKIGKFIAKLRKEKKMTQDELAKKIGVTDRAISKWENGRGMPELSLIKPLCNELEISTNEFFSGERLAQEELQLEDYENIIKKLGTEEKSLKRFKKVLFKQNESLKKYYVYESINILLLLIIVIPNVVLSTKNMIPLNIMYINTFLIIIIAMIISIVDIKNDIELKKMYRCYIDGKNISKYKSKIKPLKIMLLVSGLVIFFNIFVTIPSIVKTEDLSKIEKSLILTTTAGEKIVTHYEVFEGFKLKIPNKFKIMNDEIVNIKYPNGNPPSLVYTNERGTINIALVMNDTIMRNTQIEEYIKTMESTYKDYSKNVKIKFWERNNHKIGEIEFITEAEDTQIHNHIMAFSIDNKLRLVNFNCTKELADDWKKIGDFIINSIIFE